MNTGPRITGIYLCVFITFFPWPAFSTDTADHNATDHENDNALMGVGAHFAWILFDAIKADLETKVGRRVILFGENSMLGVGCNAGIKAARQATQSRETFGFICCSLSDEEIEKEQLIVYPLVKEPILILTHKDNPVDNLSSDQVRAIFRGDLTSWADVNETNKPIVVVTRLHCKKRPGHWKTILPDHKAFRQERLNVTSAAAMVQRVGDFRGAIGHTGATWIFDAKDPIKIIRVDGFKPTAENLRNGKYPFYRQLSAITNRRPSPDVVKLITEAQTGKAFRKVARQYELLPLNPMRRMSPANAAAATQ